MTNGLEFSASTTRNTKNVNYLILWRHLAPTKETMIIEQTSIRVSRRKRQEIVSTLTVGGPNSSAAWMYELSPFSKFSGPRNIASRSTLGESGRFDPPFAIGRLQETPAFDRGGRGCASSRVLYRYGSSRVGSGESRPESVRLNYCSSELCWSKPGAGIDAVPDKRNNPQWYLRGK